jgi:hypothetical protein
LWGADHRIGPSDEGAKAMYEHKMRIVDAREQTDPGQEQIVAAESTARHHGYWERVSELLLSIPAGVAVRIGG